MRGLPVVLSVVSLLNAPFMSAYAMPSTQNKGTLAASNSVDKPSGMFNKLSLAFLYSYTDFKFHSTKGENFNNFTGHSNLYSIAAGNVQLAKDFSAGLALFKVDTNVLSNVFISPGSPANSKQTVHNNTLFGHVLKRFKEYYYLDLAGAYGQNKIASQSWILPNTPISQYGFANSRSNNWFTSLTGLYSRPWKNFLINANARLLYSQTDAGNYFFNYQSSPLPQPVQALTNKVWFAMENIELGYKFKPTVPLVPFVNAGLIQVLSYTNSRTLIDSTLINGTLPQLSMNKNGYRLGGGFSYSYKRLTLRIEEQFYNASGTFKSYQTVAGIRYLIS